MIEMRKTNNKVNEKLRWFQILTSLYEIATPHIGAFTNVQCNKLKEGVADLEAVNHSAGVLRRLLTVTRNMPEPAEEELNCTKKHFEAALSNCINVSEALTKYVQFEEHAAESQMHLDRLINSLVLAREYVESTNKRLNFFPK